MDNIDEMLKSIDDALGTKNPDQPKDLKQSLLDEIDSAIGIKPETKKEEVVATTQPTAQVTSQPSALPSPMPQAIPVAEKKSDAAIPKAVPSPLPQPTPPKKPELDLSKPSNQVLAIVGNKPEESFDKTDYELLNTLNGQDLSEFRKNRPDISLNSIQLNKIFEYQRQTTPWKIPEKGEDWLNLGKASSELLGKDIPIMVSDITGSFLKGASKAIEKGVPFVLGQTSPYAEALEAEKLLSTEKQQEVEQWRKNAWRIAQTPLKGGEKPNPDSYTDEKYLQKVREGLTPEQIDALNKKYEQKRMEAKQVPFEVTSELVSLPENLAFMEAKVSEGGMQLWDTISEQAGLIDKEKAFERFMARKAVDTAKAKITASEPRAYARVLDTYFNPAATAIQSSYIPGFSAYTSLFHPSIEEYMITYPNLTREEAKAKRQNEIENNVLNYLEDVKKYIPETDPDLQMLGSLAMPGQFGLDVFGYALNVVQAAKALTPIAKLNLQKLRFTEDQINAIESVAQRALKERELKKLESQQTPGIIEKSAGATARGIENVGDYLERSPKLQAIGNYIPVVTGAGLGYEFDPQNPLRGMVVGGITGAGTRFGLKTLKEAPKATKEILAARRISAGGELGPLATLESIAKQQDEVKKLTAELKTLSEGTQEYIDTKKLLDDAKEKAKGIKAGGDEVVDYEGIGKVSDTTKNILKFVNDDVVSNIGEYAKLGVEPTLLGLATGIIDSSDEEELKTMISQGLVFTIGGRALQQGFHKFIGEDPVVAARKARQADVDALKTYRDSTPETREEINKLTDWNNVLERQSNKIDDVSSALQTLQSDRAAMVEKNKNDPNFWNTDEFKNIDDKIKKAEKNLSAEQKSLSLLKTANVQTRNEFGRNFLQQLARNNMRLNGSLRSGQNNVGFNILSTQQIFDHFRNNPAYRDFSDADIMTAASQQGFYSGIGGSEFNPGASVTDSTKGLIFDPNKPSIVINSDSLRNRMMLFGETPTEALNHETGHHILKIKEIQDAVADARNILFTNEIRDASGNVKEISNGLYTSDDLNEMFSKNYLKNRSKEDIAQISQSLGLWDYNINSLNPELVKNYMQEEILADMFANTLSRNVAKDLNDKRTHLFDVANLKMKNGLLKSAVTKMLGYGLSSDVVSEATNANISPEAQSAARNAMRLLESMNGDFTSIASLPQTAPISKAEIKKSKIAAERYGMDSGLFETKTVAQVFDENGKPIGTPIDVTDPAAFEGSWRIKSDGEERLSGYGQIPVSLRQLQVPNGGTLSISKKIVTEADGETPKLLKPEALKKLQKDRASLFKQAIDTPDYGTPGRFEAVSEGSNTYRGSFTPMQIKAIQDLPEGIVPSKIKKYLLDLNEAIVRKDGTRFYMDYAAVMDDKGNYKAFSPKIYDVVPIGLQLSKDGNFLVTTISVGRLMEKLNLWSDRMPNRLDLWNGSKTAFWNDFSTKYLDNWTNKIEGSGYDKNGQPIGSNQLDADVQKAEIKKSIFNDFLNLATDETRGLNLDRTLIPRRKGDPKNKSLDRTIGSMRIDHIAELLNAEHLPKLPVDYGKALINFLPENEVPIRKDWDEMLNKSLKMSYDEFVSLAKKGKIIQATGEENPFVAGTGETPLSYGAGAGYSLPDIVHFYSIRTAPMDAAYNNFLDNAEFEKISKKGVKMSYDEFISSARKGVQFMPENFDAIKNADKSLLPLNEQPENQSVSGRLTSGQKIAIDELEQYYKEKTPERIQKLKKDAEESLANRLVNIGIPVSDSKKIASKSFSDIKKMSSGAMQVISGMGMSDLSRMAGTGRPSVETRKGINPSWLTSAFESFETDDALALMKAQQVARQLTKSDQAKVAAGEKVESAKASGVRESTKEQGMSFVIGEKTADQKAFGSSLREDTDAPPRVYASVVEGQKFGSQGNYNLFFEWDKNTPMVITSHHHYGVGNGLTDIHASANIGDKNARSFGDVENEKYDTLPSGKKVLDTYLLVGNDGASDIRTHQLMVSIPSSGIDNVKRAFKSNGVEGAKSEIDKIIATQLVGQPSQGKTQTFTSSEGVPPYVAVQKNRTEAYVLNPDLSNVKKITIASNSQKEIDVIKKNLVKAFENNGSKLPSISVVSKDSEASKNPGRKAITDKFFNATGKIAFMPEQPTVYEPISARIRPLQGISAPTKVVGAKAPALGEIEPPVKGKAMLPDMELKPDISEKGIQSSDIITSVKPTIGEKTEISPKIDADYMKAVESGDVEAQQKLVDEAAQPKIPNIKINQERKLPNLSKIIEKSKKTFTQYKNPQRVLFDPWGNGDGKYIRGYKIEHKYGNTIYYNDNAGRIQSLNNVNPKFVFKDWLYVPKSFGEYLDPTNFETGRPTSIFIRHFSRNVKKIEKTGQLKKIGSTFGNANEALGLYSIGYDNPYWDIERDYSKNGENVSGWATINNPLVITNTDIVEWSPKKVEETMQTMSENDHDAIIYQRTPYIPDLFKPIKDVSIYSPLNLNLLSDFFIKNKDEIINKIYELAKDKEWISSGFELIQNGSKIERNPTPKSKESAARAIAAWIQKEYNVIKEPKEESANDLILFDRPWVIVPWDKASKIIKSDKPVTYDDAGNVIPLSQRFNPKTSDIRFMPEEGAKKPKTAKKEPERDIEPDFTHSIGGKLPSKFPDRGYFKIATKPTEDNRVIEYEVDPKTTVLPKVSDISSLAGEQVAMLEADRHNTRGSNMGGPLHPWLKSNQAIAKLPDGRGFKPVWANMTAAFVTRAKNIIKNTTSGMALIQLMKEKAHKSNRKFVQDVMSEIDSTSASIPQERLDALHVILELGAKNPAKHLKRYKKAQSLLKENEITQSEFNLIERFEAKNIEKYKPSIDFLSALGSMKSQATKGNIAAFDKAFDEHISKYKDQDWYKKIVNKYKNKTFAEEASKFTFNQRGSAMDRISGIPFIPSIAQRLLESMDFNKGKNLDIVAAVQLSKDMDAFAIYTGDDPKQEAKMSATERYLRDEFLKNPQFRIHPSYDWMMLGPEDANNFILETPADPVKLFPDYASSHPKKTVREGSKETIVGTMKKSKIPLILK